MTTNSIAKQLEEARLLLSATKDQKLAQALTTTGYDQETIKNGQMLYDNAVKIISDAETALGNQLVATKKVKELTKLVIENYRKLSQTANTIFKKDAGAIRSLSLTIVHRSSKKTVPQVSDTEPNPDSPDEPAPVEVVKKVSPDQSQAAILNQARKLYTGALINSDLIARLSKVGYGEERLRDERNDVTALEEADVAQEWAKSQVGAQKTMQKEAIAELIQWVSEFKGVVVPALKKDHPELLRMMGIKARK